MSNTFFQFKKFIIHQDKTALRVTTDACLFGAWVAHKLSTANNPHRILDIGTGTGLLALMLIQKTNAQLDALEIDSHAFLQAKENVEAAGWSKNIAVIHNTMQAFLPQYAYDHIICNPPFFKQSLKSPEPGKNLSKHEENLPLTTLATYISQYLIDMGTASLLLPASRHLEALGIFSAAGLYPAEIMQVHQTSAHDAFRNLYWLQKTKTHPINSKLIIKEEDGNYSDAFKMLLKDYYLNL